MPRSSFGARDGTTSREPTTQGVSREPLNHSGAFAHSHLVMALSAIEVDGPRGECLAALADRIPGTRECLLTSLAGDGYNGLARALERAANAHGDLFNVLLAYMNFAFERRPYFEVMARPDLYDAQDPVVRTAHGLALIAFVPAARRTLAEPDVNDVVRAAWAFTERFARQWAGGAFDSVLADAALQPGFAISMAHGGAYIAVRERLPHLPLISAFERPMNSTRPARGSPPC